MKQIDYFTNNELKTSETQRKANILGTCLPCLFLGIYMVTILYLFLLVSISYYIYEPDPFYKPEHTPTVSEPLPFTPPNPITWQPKTTVSVAHPTIAIPQVPQSAPSPHMPLTGYIPPGTPTTPPVSPVNPQEAQNAQDRAEYMAKCIQISNFRGVSYAHVTDGHWSSCVATQKSALNRDISTGKYNGVMYTQAKQLLTL